LPVDVILQFLEMMATKEIEVQSVHLSPDNITEFKDAFSVFDKNGDGTISASELEQVLGSLGQKVSTEEAQVGWRLCFLSHFQGHD
jgi:Ca2+-binding EF-hand superfamily protein